jgi:hypothetical protein
MYEGIDGPYYTGVYALPPATMEKLKNVILNWRRFSKKNAIRSFFKSKY